MLKIYINRKEILYFGKEKKKNVYVCCFFIYCEEIL